MYDLIIFSSNEFLFWFVCTYCTTLVKHTFSNTNGVCSVCWLLCACGVYRVRVMVLGACQAGTWHTLYTRMALGSVIREELTVGCLPGGLSDEHTFSMYVNERKIT